MKQFFVVRWFHVWRKQRIINRAWDMRAYPPCKFCQRPIIEQSAFCNWCGTAQYQPPPQPQRNTSGSLPVNPASVADVATVPAMPSVPVVPAPKKKRYDVTNELANYYRHGDGINHWRMKAFRRMIFDDEEGEKK